MFFFQTPPFTGPEAKPPFAFTKDDSSEDDDTLQPATPARFCLATASLKGTLLPMYATVPAISTERDGWVAAMCVGTDSVEGPETFFVALTGATLRKQAGAALRCVMHALHCLAERFSLPANLISAVVAEAEAEPEGGCCRGLASLASLLLAGSGCAERVVSVLQGCVTPQVLLQVAEHHCGKDADAWGVLTQRLLEGGGGGVNQEATVSAVFSFLSAHLPLKVFLGLLPRDGNTRFFLPFIARAMDLHHAALLKERAVAAATSKLSR